MAFPIASREDAIRQSRAARIPHGQSGVAELSIASLRPLQKEDFQSLATIESILPYQVSPDRCAILWLSSGMVATVFHSAVQACHRFLPSPCERF